VVRRQPRPPLGAGGDLDPLAIIQSGDALYTRSGIGTD